MTFTGHEDHSFPLATASEWTRKYRSTVTEGETIAHYFGGEAIRSILNQLEDGCVGIRIYYALDGEGKKQLIVVGVNGQGDDLYEGLLAERSIKCPQDCPASNPLNT